MQLQKNSCLWRKKKSRIQLRLKKLYGKDLEEEFYALYALHKCHFDLCLKSIEIIFTKDATRLNSDF